MSPPIHKQGPKPKKPRKRLPKRRARIKPGWWAKVRAIVFERDGGKCRWCWKRLSMDTMEAAHLVGLGMGGSRENENDPRNQPANVVAFCSRCHRWFDQLSKAGRLNTTAEILAGRFVADGETNP